jgi:hypothetical protein
VSATGTAPAPFLIIVAHGDGSESRIPASSYTELQALLGRMSEA